jgi:hypothetical protein
MILENLVGRVCRRAKTLVARRTNQEPLSMPRISRRPRDPTQAQEKKKINKILFECALAAAFT